MRDFIESLRSSGINTVETSPLSKSDRMAFANQLNKFLTQDANVS